MSKDTQKLLDGIRVLDLANERGDMAGRFLADMGAEVIAIEPQGGSPSRRLPPFEHGKEDDPDGSLYWAYIAVGKKSLELDIESAAGMQQLLDLAAGADILVESFDPGYMAGIGLGYEDLKAINPALVYVSITPFGQSGPAANIQSEDITIQAAGGMVSMQGDQDRRPIPVGQQHQAAFHAGGQAAADAIIALNERAQSGLGQHIDVSSQAAMLWCLMNATGFPPNEGGNPPNHCENRSADGGDGSPLKMFGIEVDMPSRLTCKDGALTVVFILGLVGGKSLQGMVDWMVEEGVLKDEPELAEINWVMWVPDLIEGKLPQETVERFIPYMTAFVETKTMVEVLNRGVEAGILVAPVYKVSDLLVDPQYQARDFWINIGGKTQPGQPAILSRTPVIPSQPAPKLNDSAGKIKVQHVPKAPPRQPGMRRLPFEGIKVADFAWVGVGPIISKAFADHGATVVHIESETRPDVLRNFPPFKNGVNEFNNGQFFANFNSSKYGLACDLSSAEGKEIARKAVDWADVVVESFTPGALARMGVGYEEMSKIYPDLIMMSTCLRGQTGPHNSYAGFGGQGAALSGFMGVTGWPDRDPVGPWGAYSDFIAPRYGVALLAAAIFERRQSGLGQLIDLSQIECSSHFLGPEILDYTVNGNVIPPQGDASPLASPHGVYQTQGTQRYIALAARTDEHWRALRDVAPLRGFSASWGLAERQQNAAAIDAELRGWVEQQDPFEVAAKLQQAGVPAYLVNRPTDLYEDEQLAYRKFFRKLDHKRMGVTPYDGHVSRFSSYDNGPRWAGPCCGQHRDYVLRDLFGFADDDVQRYIEAGILR